MVLNYLTMNYLIPGNYVVYIYCYSLSAFINI
ncbi:hypothetical protein EPYR_00658 [Erwinia pyrifoliae DSM 12163]|nr:hypothetical protein EPYR_00658 [Erwinia pyrifoliae DSM 12163]